MSEKKGLESIVPPLELCKRIPEGAFADSALVWQCTKFLSSVRPKPIWEVMPRDRCLSDAPALPAPTLEEIMAALPASVCYYLGNRWTSCFVNDTISSGEKGERGVTAALKLWLGQRRGGEE